MMLNEDSNLEARGSRPLEPTFNIFQLFSLAIFQYVP